MADHEDGITDPRYVNPTFERLMNTRVAQTDRDNNMTAVLLILPGTQEQNKMRIAQVAALTESNPTIREYNSDLGGHPVIYFP